MKNRYFSLITALFVLLLTSGCWLTGQDTYDTTKYTAAHQDALDGDDVKLDNLLRQNPSIVNVPDYEQNSLLHLAVLHNRTNTIALLIKYKADVNAKNAVLMTPLHLAAREGFLDACHLLLNYGADTRVRDKRGWTALQWAQALHRDAVAELLKSSGSQQVDPAAFEERDRRGREGGPTQIL
jgi:ankyrin repeat protein